MNYFLLETTHSYLHCDLNVTSNKEISILFGWRKLFSTKDPVRIDLIGCSIVDHTNFIYRADLVFYYRTDMMIEPLKTTSDRNQVSSNGYTLDTCFLIKTLQNPNIASFFENRENLKDQTIYINEICLNEAQKKGFDIASIICNLQKLLSARIVIKQVTISMRILGSKLESCCKYLHSGDSAILAFAKTTKTTLVTFDKNLLISCSNLGVKALNPTKMMEEAFA